MSTMQSTIRRVEEDETRKAEGYLPDDGWKPAGPVLSGDEPLWKEHQEANGGLNPVALGIQPELANYPTPSIGNIVVYHLRAGDSRNMRAKFPAVVMDSFPATGKLKLWVIVDDGDTWMQDHVPAHAAPEPGWELVNNGTDELSLNVARLGDRVEALEKKMTAPLIMAEPISNEAQDEIDRRPGHITWADPGESIKQLSDRIAALEAKRGPGRPPSPDKPKV